MSINSKFNRPNPEYILELQKVVEISPFPKHMNFRLASIGLDHATVEMTIKDYHLQPFGIVHGGVLATLIDTATFWSAYLRLPEDTGLVNIDLKLNYLRQARSGTLTAYGKCLRSGRTISYADAQVKDVEGNLVAHGTSTLMALPGEGIPLKARKFLLE